MGQQIRLRLPEKLVREIDREAGRRRKTRSELVRDVLERHIRNGAAEESPWRGKSLRTDRGKKGQFPGSRGSDKGAF